MLESNPLPSPELDSVKAPMEETADVLVVGLASDGDLSATLTEIDNATEGWMGRLIELGQVRGKNGRSLLARFATGDRTNDDFGDRCRRRSRFPGPSLRFSGDCDSNIV